MTNFAQTPKLPEGVLFDLDGTLLNTAPDLGAALNNVCALYGKEPVHEDTYTPVASHGSRGLLKLAFSKELETHESELRKAFLDAYSNSIAAKTHVYEGVVPLLNALIQAQIKVAIVTNKPKQLTQQLLPSFPEFNVFESVVCGDTLSVSKPDPAPLLLAAEQLGVTPTSCIYVGDAERDIQAGHNAAMTTVLAHYGYISDSDSPADWKADYGISTPLELLNIIGLPQP